MTDSQPLTKRRWFFPVAAIAVVIGAALAWYFVSPLFLNETVDEAFPEVASSDPGEEAAETAEATSSATPLADAAEIPEGETAESVEEQMEEAAATNEEVTESMPETAAEPVLLASGEFQGADDFHQGSGTAAIYELEDGSRILRLDEFSVTNGPDLHVFLSPTGEINTSDDVMAPGYVDLGKLKGNQGAQNYEIPADFEIPSDGFSVVIYCVPFHVLFASASVS